MATGPNFAPPLPLMQPPACRLLDPPNSPPIDPFLADRLRNHRHLAIAPAREEGSCSCSRVLHLLHYDNPIEPGRLLTREAFRFRLAVVNPLNAIGAAAAPRSHGLPGAHVVTVLNVIDLTGHRREFNHEGAIGQRSEER